MGPDRMINFLEYIASHADLIDAFGADAAAGQAHFETDGQREGRAVTFDALAYIASHPDLAELFGADRDAGATHFINTGRSDGRGISFDAFAYLAANSDLIAAFGADTGAATRHFIEFGRHEDRPTTFGALGYIAANSDLIAAFGLNVDIATQHYVTNGFAEGRVTTFDAERYLAAHADLRAAFGRDLAVATQHFITDGFREGRGLAATASIVVTATNPAGEALFGLRDADTLVGAGGPDRLDGGGGGDDLTGGGGPDVFVFDGLSMRPGDLDVARDFNPAEGDKIERIAATAVSAENVVGGALVDFALAGGGVAQALFLGQSKEGFVTTLARYGTDGADDMTAGPNETEMRGLGGGDRLSGGARNVMMFGGAGADTFVATKGGAAGSPDRVADFSLGDAVSVKDLLASRDYDDITQVLRVERRGANDMAVVLIEPAGETTLMVLEAVEETMFQRAATNPSRFLTDITDAARSQHGAAFGSTSGVASSDDEFFAYITGFDLSDDGAVSHYAGGVVDRSAIYANNGFFGSGDPIIGFNDSSFDRGLVARDLFANGAERTLVVSGAISTFPTLTQFAVGDLDVTEDERFAIVLSNDDLTVVDMRGPAPIETKLKVAGDRDANVAARQPGGETLVYSRRGFFGEEGDNGVFLHDLSTGERTQILQDLVPAGDELATRWLALSADARTVGFSTDLSLLAEDTDDLFDLYGRDLDTGDVFLISRGVEDRDIFAAAPGATMDDELLAVDARDLLFDLEAARAGVGGPVLLGELFSELEFLPGIPGLFFGASDMRVADGGRIVAGVTVEPPDFFSVLFALDLVTGAFIELDGTEDLVSDRSSIRDIKLALDGSAIAYVKEFPFIQTTAELRTAALDFAREGDFQAPDRDVSDIAATALPMPALVNGAATIRGTLHAATGPVPDFGGVTFDDFLGAPADHADWYALPLGADATGLVVRVTAVDGGVREGATLEIHRGRGPDSKLFDSAPQDGAEATAAIAPAHVILDGGGAAGEKLYARVSGAAGDYALTVIAEQRPSDDSGTNAFLFPGRTRIEALNPGEQHHYALLPDVAGAFAPRFSFSPTPDLLGDSMTDADITLHAADGGVIESIASNGGVVEFGLQPGDLPLFVSVAGRSDPSGGYALRLFASGENAAPVAVDDFAVADFQTAVTISVLDNDTDVDSGADDLTIAQVFTDGNSFGTVEINGNGTLTYTPEDGFAGVARFGYEMTDGDKSDFAEVSVTVGGPGARAFTVDSLSIVEGDSGNSSAFLVVRRTGDLRVTDRLAGTTRSGTATEFVDFVGVDYETVFGQGVSIANLPVSVKGDLEVEGSEQFFADFSIDSLFDNFTVDAASPPAGSAFDLTAPLEIIDDDVAIAIDSLEAPESDRLVAFTITRRGDLSAKEFSVALAEGTATSPEDFAGEGQFLPVQFAENQTQTTVSVSLVDDTVVEDDETFSLTLSDDEGRVAEGVATILNDDTRVSIDAPEVLESAGAVTFTVTRAGLLRSQTILVTLGEDRATAPEDFIDASEPVVFAEGQSEATFTVSLVDDDVFEFDESFLVLLSDASTGVVTNTVGAILNDDAPNRAPTAVDDGPFAATEGAVTDPLDVLANDSDPAGDALTIAGGDAFTVLGGRVVVAEDRKSLSVDYADVNLPDLGEGETRADSFDYVVSDGALQAPATVSLTVTGKADKGGLNEVLGSEGSDRLVGTNAPDLIRSLGGRQDIVTGGAGLDVFDFSDSTANAARETRTITDYEAGEQIDIGLASVLNFREIGERVLVYLDGDRDVIVLNGVGSFEEVTFI